MENQSAPPPEAVVPVPREAHAPRERKRASASPIPRFFNRELSWLDFNARVLEEAMNPAHPLLERLRFLGIFSSNLDEFFMIHVPGMRDRAGDEIGNGLTSQEFLSRLRDIQRKLNPMLAAKIKCFGEIMAQLANADVRVLAFSELSAPQTKAIADYFEREVFPVLTPLAFGPGHPFPYISNLSLSLAMVVRDPLTGEERFARVKVPLRPALSRLVPIPGETSQFIPLEDVITAHIDRLFPGMEVRDCHAFRVTRNADLELREDAAHDLMELIEEELSRRRFGEVERVEFANDMPVEMQRTIIEELGNPDPAQIYTIVGPMGMSDFSHLADLPLPDLKFRPFVPAVPPALRNTADYFAIIRQGDVLLHHPYQSFGCVVDFLRHAADDPHVLTIKHTLYRTSGDSPILQSLIDAADNGKQVACLIELKARFDEANNITWARQLEKAGVHVVYGLPGLKTHCKVTLVVRREEDGLRRYLHVGTGNYNPKTATVYTDIGLLTCDPDFGADATDLFNHLTGYSRQEDYRKFLVSPETLRRNLTNMIEREATNHSPENPGHIIAKMNALVDPGLIKALYAASEAGVKVDLIVRGMCCLRPGVPNLSSNIRVISIVGRFLEHSRIFYFRNGGNDDVYIGSADWMPRNLDRRIEVVVPVENANLRKTIKEHILLNMMEDNVQSWELYPDGCYVRRKPGVGQRRHNVQTILLDAYTSD